MIIEYERNMPPEVQELIQVYLEPLTNILPTWLMRLRIEYCSNANNQDFQDGAAIWACVSYEYRQATLVVTPLWLDGSHQYREEQFIHDLLHITTCILADYARDEIKRLLPEDDAPKYRAALMTELTARHEAMTQDLTALVQRLMKPA